MAKQTDADFQTKLACFHAHLNNSTRVLALLGAGLSAASGLPTFRGVGGMWRQYEATSLATPEAFRRDPGLVWQFYAYRRHMALQAKPNPAHYALAELARKKEGFVTLSPNVDGTGLSQCAHHPEPQLHLLHGNLFDIKCSSSRCDYIDRNNFTDPLVPALAVSSSNAVPDPSDATGASASASLAAAMAQDQDQGQDRHISASDLPTCPKCGSLLRPGVVWFGETLPMDTINKVGSWIAEAESIDLMLVIGTAAAVTPAAGYIARARMKGARVAVVNMEADDLGAASGLGERDWLFQGDAGVLVPEMFKGVIGTLSH